MRGARRRAGSCRSRERRRASGAGASRSWRARSNASADDVELALAADELRARLVRDVDAEARTRAQSPPRPGSARPCPSPRPARPPRSRRLGASRGTSSRPTRIAVHRCGALEACGRVDDVAGGHALARLGSRVEPDERFAGRDPDPHLDARALLDAPSRGSRAHARTARSGSSSCAVGAPNSAITASPMNFSTVPPWRSSSARTRSWYGPRSASTSSGSSAPRAAVKPTRSQKTTVTTLRSRRGRGHQAVFARSASPRSMKNVAPTDR